MRKGGIAIVKEFTENEICCLARALAKKLKNMFPNEWKSLDQLTTPNGKTKLLEEAGLESKKAYSYAWEQAFKRITKKTVTGEIGEFESRGYGSRTQVRFIPKKEKETVGKRLNQEELKEATRIFVAYILDHGPVKKQTAKNYMQKQLGVKFPNQIGNDWNRIVKYAARWGDPDTGIKVAKSGGNYVIHAEPEKMSTTTKKEIRKVAKEITTKAEEKNKKTKTEVAIPGNVLEVYALPGSPAKIVTEEGVEITFNPDNGELTARNKKGKLVLRFVITSMGFLITFLGVLNFLL